MDVIFDFCRTFWNVFAMMAPWLIIGFFIAGIMAVCLPRDLVMRFLGTSGGIKSIIRAVAIGVPLPICNHLAGIVLALLMINAYIRVPKMK